MIITNKQFPNYKKYEIEYEGRPLSMEIGKMCELCNAAVLVTLVLFGDLMGDAHEGAVHRRLVHQLSFGPHMTSPSSYFFNRFFRSFATGKTP